MTLKNIITKITPYIIVLSSVVSRIIPHPPNFTATNSAIIYSNARIKNIFSIFFPILIFLIEDIIRTYYIYNSKFSIYYILEVHLFYLVISVTLNLFFNYKKSNNTDNDNNDNDNNDKKINYIKVLISILTSSTVFFLWSNFIVYLIDNERTFLKVYIDALPFYGNEIGANFLYTILFFTIDYLLVYKLNEQNEINNKENLINNDDHIDNV